MTRPLAMTLIGAGLAVSTPVSAQLCNGSASFSRTPVQLSAAYAFNDDAKAFGAGLAVGGSGPFLQLTAGKTNYSKLDGSSTDLGGGAGYQFALDEDGVFHLCPLLTIVHSSGPNDITVGSQFVDLSQNVFAWGVAVGAVVTRSSPTKIIPTGSFASVRTKVKTVDQASSQSNTRSETVGVMDLGVGFLFGQVFALRPSVAFAFGLHESSTTFGASMSVNFGHRGSR